MRSRYFLAVFPCGIFKVGVFTDGKARPFAILPEGQLGVLFCFANPLNDAGLVAVETIEISRAEARQVWQLQSPLVPPLIRIAYASVRLDAARRVAPLWRAVGLKDRAAAVEARIARLERRIARLHREAVMCRFGATRGTQPIHFATNSYFAMAGFLEAGRLTGAKANRGATEASRSSRTAAGVLHDQ